MIVNKEVLGKLLLAAGYGELISVSEVVSVYAPNCVTKLQTGALVDFNITADVEPVPDPQSIGAGTLEREVLTPEMFTHILSKYALSSDLAVEIGGYVVSVKKKKECKPRQLKRIGQLKGHTVESIKTVKQGTKAYIRTADGASMCIEHAVVKQDLCPDENIALGLLTKEDLASIAKAKRMGLI